MTGIDDRAESQDIGEVVRGMLALVEHQFIEVCELTERLVLEPIRAGWSAGEPVDGLTADQVREAPPSQEKQLRASVLRWARQEQREAGRTAEDLLYDFLVGGEPKVIRIQTRRRGRKTVWTPEWEVLLVASFWVAAKVASSEASARGSSGRGVLRAAAEKYKEIFEVDLEPETTLNRYHLALKRNKFVGSMRTFAEIIHVSTWLSRHEAQWLVGAFLFADHLRLRYNPGRPPESPADFLIRLRDKLTAAALQRPDEVRQEWEAIWHNRSEALRLHQPHTRAGTKRRALGAFADGDG